jgi:hypothetical protein
MPIIRKANCSCVSGRSAQMVQVETEDAEGPSYLVDVARHEAAQEESQQVDTNTNSKPQSRPDFRRPSSPLFVEKRLKLGLRP